MTIYKRQKGIQMNRVENLIRKIWMWLWPDYFGHNDSIYSMSLMSNKQLLDMLYSTDYGKEYGYLPVIIVLRDRLSKSCGYTDEMYEAAQKENNQKA